MSHLKRIASFLTVFAFAVAAIMLGSPVYAECGLAYEGFTWNDSYEQLTDVVNEYYRTHDIGDEMTKEKLSECEYGKLYILTDEALLADYTDGDINEYIKSHSESYIENFYFSENGHTDYFVRHSDDTVCFQNRTETDASDYPTVSMSNAIRKLNKFDNIEGDIIFVRYVPLYIAIVSQNGIPKYVIILTDGFYYPSDVSEDDTSGSAAVQNAFVRLYDHGNGQYVFDFSFFKDYVKACYDKLPDDFKYTPYGLQSEKHDKVSNIGGKAYYFNDAGICTGLYTGYAKIADGTRVYYENGIASENAPSEDPDMSQGSAFQQLAVSAPDGKYNIQLECLAGSETAEELNQYRDVLLEYMNDEIEKQGKAAGTDTYSFLTANDLDFADDTKIHGIKKHGPYTDYEYDADHESFLASLGDEEYWYIVFQKEETIYSAWLYETDAQNSMDYNFADNWYIRLFFVDQTERIGYAYLKYDTDIITANINKLLNDMYESGKDIKVIFTDMAYVCTDCAVIFVNGKAKYLYYYSFLLPYQFTDRSKIPDDVYRSLEQAGDVIFNNFYHEKPDARKLYSYNMIMFLMNVCERYM